MPQSVIRVEYCASGNVQARRPDLLRGAPTLKAVLKRAGDKLRARVRRVFLADGTELDGANCAGALAGAAAAGLGNGGRSGALRLFCTRGEAWSPGPPPGAKEGGDAGQAPLAVPTVEQLMAGEERSPAGGDDAPRVRVLCSRAHVDREALRQLLGTASSLRGLRLAVGMPDLHAGKGCPIGAAFVTRGRVYPHLIDRDAGCGMSLVRTSLSARQVAGPKRLERLAERLRGLDGPWEGGSAREFLAGGLQWPAGREVPPAAEWPAGPAAADPACDSAAFDASLGTVGRGNHFAELLACESVLDADEARRLGLDAGDVYVLVHSGSRGLGGAVLDDHARRHGPTAGLDASSDEGRRYLALHAHALAWAARNRALAARRFLEAAGCATPTAEDCVLDIFHNAVAQVPGAGGAADGGGDGREWVHRKGAAPGDRGAVVIPGSRGHRSYVVVPAGDQASAAWSMAHGAGRKWHRSKALARGRARFPNPGDLLVTDLESRVVCEDRALVYEEAPSAYKDIANVVADLEERGLVRVVAVFRPLVTYKTRAREGK